MIWKISDLEHPGTAPETGRLASGEWLAFCRALPGATVVGRDQAEAVRRFTEIFMRDEHGIRLEPERRPLGRDLRRLVASLGYVERTIGEPLVLSHPDRGDLIWTLADLEPVDAAVLELFAGWLGLGLADLEQRLGLTAARELHAARKAAIEERRAAEVEAASRAEARRRAERASEEAAKASRKAAELEAEAKRLAAVAAGRG